MKGGSNINKHAKPSSKVKLFKKPDIVTVIEKEGVALKQRGGKLWALCPFHAETRPSFNVSVEKQVFYCFGCQAGGDATKFIMALRGLSYSEALRYLKTGKSGIHTERSPISHERKLIEGFHQWLKDYYTELILNLQAMQNIQRTIVSPEDLEKHAWVFDEIQKTQYDLDILVGGDDEDKLNLFKEAMKYDNESSAGA
jgi:DNA primase